MSVPVPLRRPWHRWQVYVRWPHGTDQHLGFALTRRGAQRACKAMASYRPYAGNADLSYHVRRIG